MNFSKRRGVAKQAFIFGIAGTAGVLLLLTVYLVVAGYFHAPTIGGNSLSGGTTTTGSAIASLTLGVSEVQSVDGQTAVSNPTGSAFVAYNTLGRPISAITSAQNLGTGTGTITTAQTQTLNFFSSDQSQFFMTLNAGNSYFVDVNVLKTDNLMGGGQSRIVAVAWASPPVGEQRGATNNPVALSTSGIYSLIIQVSVPDLLLQNGVQPTFTLKVPVIQDDSGSAAITAPAKATSQGTTVAQVTAEWKVTSVTAQHGLDLNRVYATSNQTTYAALTVTGLSVNGYYTIPSGTFGTPSCGTSTSGIVTCWDFYDPAGSSTQQAVGILFAEPIGTSGNLYFDVTLTRALQSGATKIGLTLFIVMLSPTGTATSISGATSYSA